MLDQYCMGCMQTIKPEETVCPHCGFDHAAAQSQREETDLPYRSLLANGRYLVGRKLGRGGFGTTYIGLDLTLRCRVAIKEYMPSSGAYRTGDSYSVTWQIPKDEWQKNRESFVREARRMATIHDIPGVVNVQDVFYQNDTAYIIMDYVDGQTLKAHLEQSRPMNAERCLDVFKPVMSALEATHQQGLIHRDVSPDNIMLDNNGTIWLLDLGAAKQLDANQTDENLSQSTHLVVRKGFSPPEQYTEAGKIGPWTDVYAVCASMYYSMTGKVIPDAMTRLNQDTLKCSDTIPPDMAKVLQKGLALRPEDRIQNMTELMRMLEGGAPESSWLEEMLKKLQALSIAAKAGIAGGCVAVLVLAVALGVYFSGNHDDVVNPGGATSQVGSGSGDPSSHVRVNSLPPEDTILATHERNVLNYTVVIDYQYEDAGLFYDGLAPVKKDGKWGYIDEENNVVIPFQYEMGWYFSEGYAVVAVESMMSTTGRLGYKIGFVDTEGTYTPFFFNDDDMWIFVDDYDKSELSFHNGWIKLKPAAYTRYYFDHFFDTEGNVLELGTDDDGYYWSPCGPSNEGLIPIYGGPNYYGWADYKGNIIKIIQTDGEEANTWTIPGAFNQGLAPVRIEQYDEEGYFESALIGFVDKSFQWVIQPEYQWGSSAGSETINIYFGDTGIAMMLKDGKMGAIDKQGNTVIPFRYDELTIETDGMIMYMADGKYGYIDSDTLAVSIREQYEQATPFNGGFAVAFDGEKAFLIDKTGNIIPGGDTLDPSTYFITDEDGNIMSVFTPNEYVTVQENGRYGFGHIEYYPDLPDTDTMDSWAYEEAASAIAEELVPASLQNLYRHNITRGDMCGLVANTIERILDVDIKEFVKERTGNSFSTYVKLNSFQDSAYEGVVACNALNIVLGESETVFNPYGHITREEAAAFLQRTAKLLGMHTGSVAAASISDADDVAPYFTDSVNYVLDTGIMDCDNDNAFRPLDTFTREEAFVAVYRLLRVVTGE